jgi:hypothetical protein
LCLVDQQGGKHRGNAQRSELEIKRKAAWAEKRKLCFILTGSPAPAGIDAAAPSAAASKIAANKEIAAAAATHATFVILARKQQQQFFRHQQPQQYPQ